ncbi:MAG: hypothetical protein GY751_04870 [Bacteroidetes bacterium]|nr:hypothetical protein [Bacteroidota bacterium]
MRKQQSYLIKDAVLHPGELRCQIQWIADHVIFKAHFPGHPVVPGALLIDLLSESVNQHVLPASTLVSSRVIKFLNVIIPAVHPEVDLRILYVQKDSMVEVRAEITSESLIFFKFRGLFSGLKDG